jgi:hypothetical protein
MRGIGRRQWFGTVVSVLSLILATLCFAFADGDGTAMFIGVLAAASGLLGLGTFFLNGSHRSSSHDTDETVR